MNFRNYWNVCTKLQRLVITKHITFLYFKIFFTNSSRHSYWISDFSENRWTRNPISPVWYKFNIWPKVLEKVCWRLFYDCRVDGKWQTIILLPLLADEWQNRFGRVPQCLSLIAYYCRTKQSDWNVNSV